MRITLFICFSIAIQSLYAQNNIGSIGSWREHYNHSNITQVVKGDRIYIAAKNQVIAYNESNGKIEYIGKSNGLHEIGIQKIAWDINTEQLIITYTNSAIDIIKGDQVYLINDIKTTTLYNNKQINNIKTANGLAFIETGFGIVVIDLSQYEIKETWQNKDLTQVEKKYQLSSISNNASIAFQTDSLKGIAIAPNLNKWIKLGGPQESIKGIASTNNQQMIYPFSNQRKGFASYSENGWTNYFSVQNSSIPVLDNSVSHPTESLFWLSNTNAVYSFDGSQIQLIQESPIGKIKNIAFSKNGN